MLSYVTPSSSLGRLNDNSKKRLHKRKNPPLPAGSWGLRPLVSPSRGWEGGGACGYAGKFLEMCSLRMSSNSVSWSPRYTMEEPSSAAKMAQRYFCGSVAILRR